MESSINVRVVNPLEVDGWDERVGQLPGATFFHSSCWARVLRDAYRFRPIYFTGEQDRQLKALLPMMEVDSWLTGRRGVSLPFTDECPALSPNRPTFHALFEAARHHALARLWKYMECRGGTEFLPGAPSSTRFFTHRLTLSPEPKVLFEGFTDSHRRAVRKADKSGLTVEFSREREAIQAFHSLLCLTRKRHGLPPQPFRFFSLIHRHILAPGKGWVVLARNQGRPVAGAVFFHFGRTALYKYGASDETLQHLRANNLVMARAIEWHGQNGFDSLDFGRTSLYQDGLRNFKRGWGATERELAYVRIDPRKNKFLSVPDQEKKMSQQLFRRLPIPVSRLIGAALYRHVA